MTLARRAPVHRAASGNIAAADDEIRSALGGVEHDGRYFGHG